jgi:hypothetical protein
MKSLLAAMFFAGAALVSDCAFHEHSIVLDVVRPTCDGAAQWNARDTVTDEVSNEALKTLRQ